MPEDDGPFPAVTGPNMALPVLDQRERLEVAGPEVGRDPVETVLR
jgi:hypothetical protein